MNGVWEGVCVGGDRGEIKDRKEKNRTLLSIIPSEPSSQVSLSIRFPRMSHGKMQYSSFVIA